MGVEPLVALPPWVLVAGRLQCGAARAGVRRGHGECVELAHLAPRLERLIFHSTCECLGVFSWGWAEIDYPITPQILGRLWEVATSSGSAC